jgi:hypothetical protein
VIDRNRIFLFRPKTNIRQENAAEYSADNEYSAQGSKHCKNVNLNQEQKCFLGWQLQVSVNGVAPLAMPRRWRTELKKTTSGKDSVIGGQPLLLFM